MDTILVNQLRWCVALDQLELGVGDFFCYKHAVITQDPNAIANTQQLGQFPEFYSLTTKIHL